MKAIEIKGLKKTYKNGVKALKGISFDVEQGEFFGLLGPNGAGKSTTINIICSLVNKSSGTAKIQGFDLDKENADVKSCIGLVPQEFNFNIFEKVKDIIADQGGYYGVPREKAVERTTFLLKKLGLSEKAEVIAKALSGGMKRKLMIARALVHEPKVLILDEPTAGVDVETRREMWEFLEEMSKNGTTIILTTHYLEEAEQLCKRIAIIDKGTIVENTTIRELLSKLDVETFIMDLEKPVKSIPDAQKYQIKINDPTTLFVDVKKEHDLNTVFKHLEKHKIKVISMRNKVNRLEELFVRLTKK